MADLQTLFDELATAEDSGFGALGCFMVNSVADLAPHEREVAAIAAAYNAAMQRLLAEALTRAARPDRSTNQKPTEQLAAFVFNALQGLRILIKAEATPEEVAAISALALQRLEPFKNSP